MSEKVQILLSAKNLIDEDTIGKSDPFVLIKDVSSGSAARLIGQTEVLKDNLNPNFQKPVVVDYFFEILQTFQAEIYDFDKDGSHDLMGTAQFTMGQLMSSRGSTLTLPLSRGKGTITLTGLHEGNVKGSLKQINIRARQLKNLDTFGKSDPFFRLLRVLPNGGRQEIYKSEVVDNNLDPAWKVIPNEFDLAVLCSGNPAAKSIAIEVYDEDVTENEEIGECIISVQELIAPNAEHRLVTKNNANDCAGYVCTSGVLAILPSFLGMLKAGLQLNIAFSIDFTGSNLEYNNPKSLHFYHPTQPNQYIQAMLAISSVVQEYDNDKNFPAFAFGAIIPGEHDANHFFHMNLTPNPYHQGMQSLIDAYVHTLPQIRFYGPTNFAPTIRNLTDGSRKAAGVYTILLILTDGAITDLDETICAIVDADDAPLSILIVGVGSANFDSMSALDSDGKALRNSSTGRVARRDLVQFVRMADFIGRPAELASALLAEIPGQVSKWALLCPQNAKPFLTN